MKLHIKNVLSLALLFATIVSGFGQSNPVQETHTLLSGQIFETSFISQGYTAPSYIFTDFDISILDGDIEVPVLESQNSYKISFKIRDDYKGSTSMTIKYYEGEGIWTEPRYLTLNFNVVSSWIITKHDYKSILVNDPGIQIDVVSNDTTTHGPLKLRSLVLVQNGTAQIIDDSRIEFIPEPGFKGMGYLNYVVENEMGITQRGTLSICVLDDSSILSHDVIRISTLQKQPISILLPANGFVVQDGESPGKGSIEFLGADVIEYQPFTNAFGDDRFVLVNNDRSLSREVVVQIIESPVFNGAVRDDKFYTEINQVSNFNVLTNDLVNTDPISSYSTELTNHGNGDFSYAPPPGYSGVKNFSYSTFNGYEHQTGKISIHIGNFYPESLSRYEFVTRKNSPFIINYKVPIDEFGFNKLSSPNHGTLSILPGMKSYDYSCGEERGLNMVVYTPDVDYTGIDEFDLEYCVGDTPCRVLKIQITIEENSECGCAGIDCVWAGDSNNDGKVSISDLLPIGYHMGATGTEREPGDHEWMSQFGEDWSTYQTANGQNLKYIDTNGDGIVSPSDTMSISQHYSLYHNLAATEILAIKEFPFRIKPNAFGLEKGDLLTLEIYLGSSYFPVTELHGLAYTLQIAPSFVDSSSVFLQFHDHWFGYNSPTLHMFKQPTDGKIDVASSRTSGISINGEGLIHTVGLIIEDELEGFKREGGTIPIKVLVKDIQYINNFGERLSLPDQEIELEFYPKESIQDKPDSNQVLMYPNPSHGPLHIHINGDDVLQSVEIFNLTGQQLLKRDRILAEHFIVETSHFQAGIYLARIRTSSGVFTQKFQVIDRY